MFPLLWRDGVMPLYHTIPLSFLLFASPGGLHHLIWINEEVDLRPSFSLSLFPLLAELYREKYIVFSQTPSTSASVS